MGTYESVVTSCSMIACGKIGANASGPTGSRVAGLSGGSSWKGRSGTRLYQLSGMAFSSRRNFVLCISHLRCSAVRDQASAYSFSRYGVSGDDENSSLLRNGRTERCARKPDMDRYWIKGAAPLRLLWGARLSRLRDESRAALPGSSS